ncbi:gap junction delta-4 protein [Colossoma macropomum]|uniref:gap junction delta-4 protein n=1 Tax=Colossoma macropomum TaxID=42526 RepID=UPI0018648F15|nr:gap junction delta-4 protein [Colossoma macropomum]
MGRQSPSEAVFIALNYNITIVGKVWLVLTVFLRILVLFFAGYPLYQDEQDRFVCNTIQPGCANVCYDIFAPLSLFRFWLVQLTSICLPYIIFVVYVIHKVLSNLPADLEASERMKLGSLYKIYEEPLRDTSLSKATVKSEVGRLRRFTGAYIFHLLLRILLEAGFGAAHYYLFGFHIPKRFMCQQSPCTIMVDCYISRPTEKTIMLNYMLGVAALSLLLNIFDLTCAIKRSVRKKSKKKMLVEKMYEEERYFVSGNGGTNSAPPVPQDLLARGSFRKRISKACADDGASLQLEGDLHLPAPHEGPPLGINLGIPGSINGNKASGYPIPQDEGMEREGSEVALCPPEPLGTPRSIRVNKRSRLKPPPPPRKDRPASAGALDITEATAVCTRRVGQYTLVEMSTGNDLPSSSGDGQEKKSEWV